VTTLSEADSRQPTHAPLQTLTDLLGDTWIEGSGPLYKKLAAALQEMVEHGFLATGTRLPAEREFAEALYVSRSTVASAYATLRRHGVLASKQGSGTWVCGRLAGTYGDEEGLSALAQDPYLSNFIDPSPAPIDLTVPMPTAALETLFATALPRQLGRELLRETSPVGYQPRGLASLRAVLARYLGARGLPTSPEQILITSGAQQAISLIQTLFVRPLDEVIVENPTHRGLIDTLLFSRARAIPLCPDGVSVPSRLSDLLSRHSPRLIFLTPTCQHPTGTTIPDEARREIVRVAAKFSVPIVEDSVLADLSLEPPPPPLASYARGSTPVLLIGSVSKILWGGLRVGWIRAPTPLISRLARLKALADMGTSAVSQVVVRELLGKEERILTIQREEVATTLKLMEDSLRTHLPEWRWRQPKGGRTLWVRLPRGDGRDFAQFALISGVALSSGDTLTIDGSHTDYVRIPFVYPPKVIREGCRRLEDAWAGYTASLSDSHEVNALAATSASSLRPRQSPRRAARGHVA
jgi:DNA-binding transcriptional MocR family regulator